MAITVYNHNIAGTLQSIAKDQEVPIVTASSAAISEAGKTTFEFQSLEMEAESELQEIQTMLSMFDDIPATTLSDQDKPQNTHCHGHLTTTEIQSQRQGSNGNRPSIVTTDQMSFGNCINGSKVTAAGDDMDIESILHEMNTIDGKGAVNFTYVYSQNLIRAEEHNMMLLLCLFKTICNRIITSLFFNIQTSFKICLKPKLFHTSCYIYRL